MVYNLHGNAEIEAGNDSTLSNRNDNATSSKSGTPSSQKSYPNGWDLIRQRYQNEGIDESSINILLTSWRKDRQLHLKHPKRGYL